MSKTTLTGVKEMKDKTPDKPATCQYCLADGRYTPLGPKDEPRCPVCGSAYSGPRRDEEYRVLLEAGLVAEDD